MILRMRLKGPSEYYENVDYGKLSFPSEQNVDQERILNQNQ